ncbi:extracellular solute-binding protein [Sulfolobus sp. E11-6]|uniref:extracellular solute-binding protein n=1 Tax=Sulfolobus sp. E11-6 TaxID=2663020 RepID=UPI001295884D|nr:extracellular solute-binding protein [Sulfolobus sp. E11-6]QGA68103.1 extracellular solute-binding protein [Sulfolobus sp. E11-6]
MVKLIGMTWNDPRGYDSIRKISEEFRKNSNIEILWDKRSLYDFTVYPVDKLADMYDLIVVDYPAVGDIAKSNKFIPIDEILPKKTIEYIQKISIGKTFESYLYEGRLWAIPIDAAVQVSAYRPDLFTKFNLYVPRNWNEVKNVKSKCKIGMPLSPIHLHSSFITLSVNLGINPFYVSIDSDTHNKLFEILGIIEYIYNSCQDLCIDTDPIKLLNYMAEEDDICYVPLIYGYYNYSRKGYRKNIIKFSDIPTFSNIPYGSVLGGAGLSISKKNKYIDETIKFIEWFLDFNNQKIFFKYLGQPSDVRIWLDMEVNEVANNSYLNTLCTINLAYIRPNFPGFVNLHEEAGKTLRDFILNRLDKKATIEKLREINSLYIQ